MRVTCKQAAAIVRQKKRDVLAEIELAEHQTLNYASEEAYRMSSGSATTKVLSTPVDQGGLGHPYGYGREGSLGPRGPIPNGGDPAIVNVQTGQFLQGWQMIFGAFRGGRMTNRLVNETEHAKWIEGTPTKFQIRRPFLERLAQRVIPVRIQNLQDAFRRADKP